VEKWAKNGKKGQNSQPLSVPYWFKFEALPEFVSNAVGISVLASFDPGRKLGINMTACYTGASSQPSPSPRTTCLLVFVSYIDGPRTVDDVVDAAKMFVTLSENSLTAPYEFLANFAGNKPTPRTTRGLRPKRR
jgi:hypothetical protein